MSEIKNLVFMNAAELADMLRSCPEYDAYYQAKQNLIQQSEDVQLLASFRTEQMRLHMQEMLGEDVSEKVEELNSFFNSLYQNEAIAKYLNAETEFYAIMQEVQEILADVLNVWEEEELCMLAGPVGDTMLN